MGIDLVEIWNHMSIIVKIITIGMIAMSVFMFYVIAERLLTYRAASDQSIRYVQALGEYLRQHKVNEALNSARSMSKSPVAKVMEFFLKRSVNRTISWSVSPLRASSVMTWSTRWMPPLRSSPSLIFSRTGRARNRHNPRTAIVKIVFQRSPFFIGCLFP